MWKKLHFKHTLEDSIKTYIFGEYSHVHYQISNETSNFYNLVRYAGKVKGKDSFELRLSPRC